MQTLTHDGFQSTCWPLVRLAQQSQGKARSALYGLYWRAVGAFLRRLGVRSDDVEDITQGFFLMLEERQDLRSVDPARGKFRSWLRTCARRYLCRVRAHSLTRKAGGNVAFFSADAGAGDGSPYELRECLEPEVLTTEREAQAIVSGAENRLRAWYERRGKANVYAALIDSLHESDGTSDAERATALKKRVASIKQERRRMRKRFATYVKKQLRSRGVPASGMRKRLKELDAALAASEELSSEP